MTSLIRGLPARLRAAAIRGEVALWAQKARSAQRRKDWRSAVEFWRRATEAAPGDRAAAIGYISALTYAGDLDDAAERAVAFIAKRPQDENGPVALARIAEARGDSAEGLRQWRDALRINPFHRQALIRLGTALAGMGQFREAAGCADTLVTRYPQEPHGPILHAEIEQASAGFAAAAPLWREAEKQFGNDLHFLRAYGRALLSAGALEECVAIAVRFKKISLYEALRLEGQILARRAPHQDQTDFWKTASGQLPDNVDLTRKLLHASLWGRRQSDAKAAFERLLLRDELRASDADYVVGLSLAELNHGGRADARIVIRRFLRRLRGSPEYRKAALRLSRLILACFPRKAGAAVKIARSEQRFRTMITNARLGSGATEPLENVAAFEAALARSGACCLLDTDIDPDSCRKFIRLVRDHLASRTPFGFVRLGDGEANAFQENSSFASLLNRDSAEREKVWWGRELDMVTRDSLATQVRIAALNAKALGFPTREWFLRDVHFDGGPPLSAGKSGRGLLVILEALRSAAGNGNFSGKLLTSAHLPQDLQRWNLYGEFFDGISDAVLVSCHADLPDLVLRRFGLRTAKHVLIPPGDTMREIQQRMLDDKDLPPQSTLRALDDLGDWAANRLVLVGAGYAGKVIVDEAVKRGGVALDLGSIFDYWAGAHTRSYQDLA